MRIKFLPIILLSTILVGIFTTLTPLRSIHANEFSECMDECRLQGGNSCVSNCNSLIGSETTACGWLGCNALGFDLTRFDNVNVLQIIALISSLVFIGIIVIGVVYVIKGSLKIISSEGDSSKIEEGTKIFKGVMIGLVMIFLGILGVLLMIALFDASSVTQVSTDLPTLN